MGFPANENDTCWSGLKSFIAKEDASGATHRKTLSILKRNDGLRDLPVFESVFLEFRQSDKKYVFQVISKPIVLRDQECIVHLMSRKDIKFAAVDLVEKLGM